MEIKIINGNIIHLNFKTQYLMCSTLMRVQEYYESPFDEIRGHKFTVEKFMDRYAEEYGDFSYTSDWGGFNIPGHIVKEFFNLFRHRCELLNKEVNLMDKLFKHIREMDKFYLIGTCDSKKKHAFDHEIAHALFYLNDDYRNKMLSYVRNENLNLLYQYMLDIGYCVDVLEDEAQAYLATGLYEDMEYCNVKQMCSKYKKIFKRYK